MGNRPSINSPALPEWVYFNLRRYIAGAQATIRMWVRAECAGTVADEPPVYVGVSTRGGAVQVETCSQQC